jgi:nucleotide-binding universal stress UspA family protein
MFGSTTERVLRETRIPALITPATDPGPDNLEDVRTAIRTVLVPVDLTAVTVTQVRIARGLAEALDASIVLAHIMEPVPTRPGQESLVPRIDRERRKLRSDTLARLKDSLPPRLRSEIVFGYGDPAEEIARIARERHAGTVVMGLHSAEQSGPCMGSVTYRVLCQVPSLIVALPPGVEKMVSRQLEVAHAGVTI